jgi:hypothetical protein
MALERRNALAAKLLSVVDEDARKHALIQQGNVKFGESVRSLGIGGGSSGILGMLTVIALAFGAVSALVSKLMGYITGFFGLFDIWSKSSFLGRVRNFFRVDSDDSKSSQRSAPTSTSPGTSLGTSSDISPLIPEGVSVSRIQTGKSTEAQRDAISRGSAAAGADMSLMYGIAGAESTFKNEASSGTSSAQGLFQFTEGTWTELVKQLKLNYKLEDRNNPEKASYVASMYIVKITNTLTQVLGRKPSYGETYLGYFLGPSGGSRFLQALIQNPNAIGSELFPRAASANRNIFFAGSKPMTLGQTLAKLEGKIVSYASESGQSKLAKAGSPNTGSTESSSPPAPTQSAKADASARPAPDSKINIPGSATAKAQPTNPAVSLPTAEITNTRRKLADLEKAKEQKVADSAEPTTGGPMDDTKSQDRGMPFKGRDGRLYTAS